MFDGSHLCCGWRGLAFMGRRNQVNTGLIIVIGIAVVFIGFPVLLVLFSASLIALAALWLFALQAVGIPVQVIKKSVSGKRFVTGEMRFFRYKEYPFPYPAKD